MVLRTDPFNAIPVGIEVVQQNLLIDSVYCLWLATTYRPEEIEIPMMIADIMTARVEDRAFLVVFLIFAM